jgi:peptide/nickel transport system substrate-binding protein
MTSEGGILGRNLKELRLSLGLKQDDVAKALGVPTVTYSSWERGRTNPDIDWLPRFARYFRVSYNRLLREPDILKIGSWIPLMENARFHPIKFEYGFYTLVYSLVFQHLYYFDPERQIYPELAESWRADRENSRYIFVVRSDVKFHNGEVLELADVKRSFDCYLEEYDFFQKFIEGVEIRDEEHAVELKLRPGKWLKLDDLPSPYIIPGSCVDSGDEFCFTGTGPYKLTDKQQKILQQGFKRPVTLEGNDAYYGRIPSIKTAQFQRFGKIDDLKTGLNRGDINFAVALEMSDPDRFIVEHGIGVLSYYIVFKQDSDGNLRKAIDSIDREALVEAIGLSKAAVPRKHHLHLLLSDAPDADAEGQDDAGLDKSGYSDTVLRISSRNRDPETSDIDPFTSEVIDRTIEQLKAIGISAEPCKELGQADAFVEVLGFRSPLALHSNLHSSGASGRPYGYSNPYMDRLLDDIGVTDPYPEIQKVLTAERLFIPLLNQRAPITYTKDLNTRHRLKTTTAPYGSDIVHWEFAGQKDDS